MYKNKSESTTPNVDPPPSIPPPAYTTPPQNVVVVGQQFGSESQRLTCPHCHSNVSTTVQTEPNIKTHLIALLLCAMGLCCCVPCPYFIDSCLVKKHYCPSCNAFLGTSVN